MKDLIKELENNSKLEVKTSKEEFVVIKKSKMMAGFDFILDICAILLIGSILFTILL